MVPRTPRTFFPSAARRPRAPIAQAARWAAAIGALGGFSVSGCSSPEPPRPALATASADAGAPGKKVSERKQKIEAMLAQNAESKGLFVKGVVCPEDAQE